MVAQRKTEENKQKNNNEKLHGDFELWELLMLHKALL
jgi:hypothetical protein